MNENVGATFGLSFLVVAFFAVILYQPDPPPVSPTATAKAEPAKSPIDLKTTTATVTEVLESAPPPSVAAETTSPPVRTVSVVSRRVVTEAATPTPTPSTKPLTKAKLAEAQVSLPRAPFTTVRAGERLADVASRVYGKDGSAEALWKANPDLVSSADQPLRAGMVVRTP